MGTVFETGPSVFLSLTGNLEVSQKATLLGRVRLRNLEVSAEYGGKR